MSGFAERAFLANERKMIEDAEIIVREDFEPVVKAEVEAEMENNNKKTVENVEERLQDKSKDHKNGGRTFQDRKSCDIGELKPPSTERGSISSISSFSSSFVIDRIFHWRKSKSCKDDNSTAIGVDEQCEDDRIGEIVNDNDKQIDCIAAQSLAVFNSVTSESNLAVGDLPEKPLKFHIKQLELILMGSLSPTSSQDLMEVQLKLDSLRVMHSLQLLNRSRECQSQNVYDYPRYLHT